MSSEYFYCNFLLLKFWLRYEQDHLGGWGHLKLDSDDSASEKLKAYSIKAIYHNKCSLVQKLCHNEAFGEYSR